MTELAQIKVRQIQNIFSLTAVLFSAK